MALNARKTIILSILVLFSGRYLNDKTVFFQHYNIPEPVSGGVIVSVTCSLLYFLFDFSVIFSLQQRDTLLIVFFTCVGLSSNNKRQITGV